VPGTRAASVFVREKDHFKYVAAVGYELEELQKVLSQLKRRSGLEGVETM